MSRTDSPLQRMVAAALTVRSGSLLDGELAVAAAPTARCKALPELLATSQAGARPQGARGGNDKLCREAGQKDV